MTTPKARRRTPAHTEAGGLDGVEVIGALNAVLSSDGFVRSPRSRGFLAYVVTEALAGRGDRLSERVVAREALRRAGDFDGRDASVVRVRASRVRAALTEYYASAGSDDPVVIELPTGSYCPVFRPCDPRDSPPPTLDGGVVVTDLEHIGPDPAEQIARSLGDGIAHLLAGFPGLRVVGPTSAPPSGTASRMAMRLGLRFVLSGSVSVRGDRIRLAAHLSDATTGETVWRASMTKGLAAFSGFDVEDAWAAAVAGELGDWTGVIHRAERARPGDEQRTISYRAHLAFCSYQEDPTPVAIVAAATALDAAIDAGDRSAALLAMRGWIHASEAIHGPTPGDPSSLDRGEALAREALGLEPDLATAHIAMCNLAMVRHHWAVATGHAARAAELAPHHPTTLFAAATGVALSGDWPGGLALAREAFRLNPRLPGAYHVLTAIACLLDGDDAGALAEASLVHSPGQLWGPLYRALALAGLGHLTQARAEMDAVLHLEPGFLDNPESYFRTGMQASDEQMRVLLGHLKPFQEGMD